MSFPDYPTRRNVVSSLPNTAKCRFQVTRQAKFLFPDHPVSGMRRVGINLKPFGIHDCVIQANEAGDSEWELSLGPSAAGARSLSGRGARS